MAYLEEVVCLNSNVKCFVELKLKSSEQFNEYTILYVCRNDHIV